MNDKIALDVIRTISATLDKAVYWVISLTYEVIKGLSSVDIFKDAGNFAIRVYTLIGLFMIFKISFSLINYLINPDSITDKDKGASKLIQRVVITFVLIVAVPQGFSLLKEAQNALLEDKVVERFILGEDGDEGANLVYRMNDKCDVAQAASEGDYIALLVYRPFFQLEKAGTTSGGATLTESEINDFISVNNYCKAESVSDLLKVDIYNAPTSGSAGSSFGIYRVDYWFVISAIVGGAVALLMVSFCMDVAVRSIKLGFLELISPIPIISYMDPSQSKGGMFKKWLTEVGKTWADLFIRLGAIYIAISIISSLDNIWEESSMTNHKYWVFLFLIIGALIFAKKLPSLVESILGIKLSGGFTFNPLKKIQDEALFGKSISKAIGKTPTAVGGALLSGIGAGIAYNRTRKKFTDEKNNIAEQDRKLEQLRNSYLTRLKNFQGTPQEKQQLRAQLMAEKEQYQAQKEAIEASKKSSQEKLQKLQEENDKFSYNHPFKSGAAEVARGAMYGYKKGAKSPAEIIANSISAAKLAADIRNKNDTFGTRTRIEDIITDISGVKNSSGTTSEIKGAIKAQQEKLTDIANAINSLNTSLAYVNQNMPGAIRYDKETGKASTNDRYDWGNSMMTQKQVQQFLDDLSTLRKSQQDGNKNLKALEDNLKLKENKGK